MDIREGGGGGAGTVMSIIPLSLYHSKDVLPHLDVLTNLMVGLRSLCERIRMTLMAIRATADSDLLQERAASGQTAWIWH